MDDEAKLTLHGLQQHYVKLKENEKNKKLFELLDILEFNQVLYGIMLQNWTRVLINLYAKIFCSCIAWKKGISVIRGCFIMTFINI